MLYVNEDISISPSAISRRQKYRDTFMKHQERHKEKVSYLKKKLHVLKSIRNTLDVKIQTFIMEIERNERISEETERNLQFYINSLYTNNQNVEKEILSKYYGM